MVYQKSGKAAVCQVVWLGGGRFVVRRVYVAVMRREAAEDKVSVAIE